MQYLLSQLEPGLLDLKLKPLRERLGQLIEKRRVKSQNVVAKRVRIVRAGKRLGRRSRSRRLPR